MRAARSGFELTAEAPLGLYVGYVEIDHTAGTVTMSIKPYP